MTGTLITILTQLINRPDADDIRINDGADTWDLPNLYDATVEGGGDGREYYEDGDGNIYAITADGYIGDCIYRRE